MVPSTYCGIIYVLCMPQFCSYLSNYQCFARDNNMHFLHEFYNLKAFYHLFHQLLSQFAIATTTIRIIA